MVLYNVDGNQGPGAGPCGRGGEGRGSSPVCPALLRDHGKGKEEPGAGVGAGRESREENWIENVHKR